MRVVTIDGPAGAGKSTVARLTAERLAWRFLDTGAMYRAVTLAALDRGVDLADADALARLAATLHVELTPDRVILDGVDVSAAIRRPEITNLTHFAAGNSQVRRRLVSWQRAFAASYDTVTEGRDQGTVVFPDALCKFFLTADLRERARRRQAELAARGEDRPIDLVEEEIRRRDQSDQNRADSPLAPAADAILLDTTDLTVDQVVDRILDEVRPALASLAYGDNPS